MNSEDLICYLVDAAKNGNASVIVAAIVSLGVLGVRSIVAPRYAFFSSDLGGALLALGVAFSGGLLTATLAGAPLSLSVVSNCLSVAFAAIGGYSVFKKLFAPLFVRALASLGFDIKLETLEKALHASQPKRKND